VFKKTVVFEKLWTLNKVVAKFMFVIWVRHRVTVWWAIFITSTDLAGIILYKFSLCLLIRFGCCLFTWLVLQPSLCAWSQTLQVHLLGWFCVYSLRPFSGRHITLNYIKRKNTSCINKCDCSRFKLSILPIWRYSVICCLSLPHLYSFIFT
jgi:hypothetical protein